MRREYFRTRLDLRGLRFRAWSRQGGCLVSSSDASRRSASSAAIAPVPAAVTAWRYVWSTTSPAAKTPRMFVAVEPGWDEVPGLVVVELVEEEARVRIVSDRDEESLRRDLLRLVGVDVADRTPVSRPSSPSTSSTTALVTNSIFGFARARSSMIGEARNSSRRWTIGHLVGELRQEDRLLHRRVAAADDDDLLPGRTRRRRPRSTRRPGPGAARSDSRPSWRALAPVATITARARNSSSPTSTRNGRSEKSTSVTSSVRYSAPKRSA